jgi:UDP-glucose 4-epimerase
MARVVVIGGSGFIGSHTVDLLLENGHDVTVADIVDPKNKDVRFIRADITRPHEIQNAVERQDYVYALAANKYVTTCFNDPPFAVRTNVQGLTNILEASKKSHVRRVLFASSVWAYNGCHEDNVDEDTALDANALGSFYGYTKVMGEGLMKHFKYLYDLDYTIFRYGVAMGPGASDETVISKFIRRSLEGKPLQILGTGEVSRNFLYVTDHARANVMALDDVAINQTINIEGSEKITVSRVARTAVDLSGRDVEIQYSESRAGEFNGKNVSITKAKKLLNWEPEVTFDEGMVRCFEHESNKKCYSHPVYMGPVA